MFGFCIVSQSICLFLSHVYSFSTDFPPLFNCSYVHMPPSSGFWILRGLNPDPRKSDETDKVLINGDYCRDGREPLVSPPHPRRSAVIPLSRSAHRVPAPLPAPHHAHGRPHHPVLHPVLNLRCAPSGGGGVGVPFCLDQEVHRSCGGSPDQNPAMPPSKPPLYSVRSALDDRWH